jgi:hypothetical protein
LFVENCGFFIITNKYDFCFDTAKTSNNSDSSDDDRFFYFRNMRKQSEKAKQERNKGGGSKVGKASNLNRFRTDYDKLLKKDYFGENPIYSSAMFRRRF